MLNSVADFDDDPILALEESGELVAGRSSTKDWPNEKFFGNGLLALIYKCGQDDDLPRQYEDIARDLQTVLDEQAPDITRSRAVLAVASWLKRQQNDLSGHKTWLQSAAELGHPEAINQLVLNQLNQAGYKVIEVTEAEPFPPTIQIDVDRLLCRSTFSCELLVDHLGELVDVVDAGAPEWCDSELLASIQNIILFFIFGIKVLADVRNPSFHLLKGARTYKDRTKPDEDWAERAAALEDQLFWLDEVWGWLIKEYVKRSEGPQFSLEKKCRDLLSQRQIVKLFLRNLPTTTCEDELFFLYSEVVDHAHAQNRVAVPEQEPKATMPANEEDHVVLLKGRIPPASEKMDVQYLKRFEILQDPLPLTPLPSLSRIREINDELTTEFPWAEAAVRQVTRELFARAAHGSRLLSFSPILLVGPPGSGKTRFSQRLAELLGVENTVINCAGMNDVKTFKGLTRGWASARPSLLIERLVQTQRANHLFLLDEIDKMGGQHYDGSPHAALLDLLEPGNARRYSDLYLLAEVDLSHCLFVATANSLEPIPAPLLDRLQPIFFPQPGPEHAPTLIRGVALDLERSWGLPVGAIGLDTHQREILAGLPARQLRRAMVQLLAEQAEHRPGGMLPQ
jgi:hypothetical protein